MMLSRNGFISAIKFETMDAIFNDHHFEYPKRKTKKSYYVRNTCEIFKDDSEEEDTDKEDDEYGNANTGFPFPISILLNVIAC